MFRLLKKAVNKITKSFTNDVLLDGIKTNNLEKVQKSLKNGANPNTNDEESNQRALGLASCYSSKEIVMQLSNSPRLEKETLLCALALTHSLNNIMPYVAKIKSFSNRDVTKVQLTENIQLLENDLDKNTSIANIRKYSRTLNQGWRHHHRTKSWRHRGKHYPDANILLQLPSEILCRIAVFAADASSKLNTEIFTDVARYQIAATFFKRPPTEDAHFEKEKNDLIRINYPSG